MTITMGSAAISSADPEMTSSDTTPVTRMATKLAWKAGWALNVTMVCGWVNQLWVSVAFGGQVLTSPVLRCYLRWGEILAF